MFRNLIIFSLLVLGISSCSEDKEPPFDLPKNATQLLTSDSVKTWKLAQRFNNNTRMNMGDCFLSYRQSFRSNGKVNDNNGEQNDCGPTLFAEWKFTKSKEDVFYLKLTSDQIPELMNIEENYKFFKILDMTDELLVLQFQHKQFSNKTTTITDFFVPQEMNVEGREFHW
ncbi:MAG: hypothetical protein AB8B73_08365 [Ekhidna sp.]